MRLTKSDGGRRVTSVLSESSAGRRSCRRERASGLARSLLGTWTVTRDVLLVVKRNLIVSREVLTKRRYVLKSILVSRVKGENN